MSATDNTTAPLVGADDTTHCSARAQTIGAALLGRAAVIIWNDIASEGRAAFYTWHDGEHTPERLSIPGFRRGRRLIRVGHSPEWLTMYEADDLSVLTSSAYLARLNAPTPLTQKTLPYFRNTSRAVCRVIASQGSSTGGHMLAMRISVPPAQVNAFVDHLAGVAFPRALATTGIVACHLFAADEGASFINTEESSNRAFDVPAWVLLAEATLAHVAEAMQRTLSEDLARFGADVRSDAGVYALELCRISE